MSMHMTKELLEAVAIGKIPPRVLVEIVYKHVLSICETCREEDAKWRRQKPTPTDYAPAFDRLRERLAAEEPAVNSEEEVAQTWFEELVALPQEERIRRIDRARTRFRGSAFARRLVEAAGESRGADPEASYQLAQAAEWVLYKSGVRQEDLGLLAQSAALMGNARRVVGDLAAADRFLGAARMMVERWGVTDLLACAEIDSLEGSLRIDQRRLKEAEELFTRAAMLYGVTGDTVGRGKTLLNLSRVYHLHGSRECLEQAVETVFAAFPDLDLEVAPIEYVRARYNLAHYLHDLGRHREGFDHLDTDHLLFEEHADPGLKLRVRWLHGKLRMHLDRESEAEKILLTVRDGFAERPLDQAHVGLDLAMLYLRQGRLDEVKRVAEEAVVLFEAQAIHQEALAALMLFRQAAEREAVNEELVRKLASFLDEAARDPKARFEPAS